MKNFDTEAGHGGRKRRAARTQISPAVVGHVAPLLWVATSRQEERRLMIWDGTWRLLGLGIAAKRRRWIGRRSQAEGKHLSKDLNWEMTPKMWITRERLAKSGSTGGKSSRDLHGFSHLACNQGVHREVCIKEMGSSAK
ncbi:unnamed protein product [Lampetra planeri]